jgi:hypothetical protein
MEDTLGARSDWPYLLADIWLPMGQSRGLRVVPSLPLMTNSHWQIQDPLAPAPCGMSIMAISCGYHVPGRGDYTKVSRC